jgi:hypothetical protein
MLAGLVSGNISPVYLADLTFTSGVYHVWSGVGNLSWNGNVYQGVGDLGNVSDVVEGLSASRTDGMTLTLSGIDTTLLNDCMADVQVGAPVYIWYGLFSEGQILGAPAELFGGIIDKPSIQIGPDTMTISLALETRMMMFKRPTARRYTTADQRRLYPTDTGFNWVEILNDIALRWGS